MSRPVPRRLLGFLLLSLFWPGLVVAQPLKAGVVTTLHGVATVARVALAQEIPLKFKDDVFWRDRITTRENSIVRVLLGGKALVTVRELSVLTITEEPGRATVDLKDGKIGLAVARQRLRPGESVEVRTLNAVAAVRGTVMVVEVLDAKPEAGAGPATTVTNVHCLRGECRYGHRGSHRPPGVLQPEVRKRCETGTVVGTDMKPPAPCPPLAQILLGLASDPQHRTPSEEAGQKQLDQAVALNGALLDALGLGAGGVDGGPPPWKDPSTSEIGVQEKEAAAAVGPPPTMNLIANGGFETGTFAPWVVSRSGGALLPMVVGAVGPIGPPEGTLMASLGTAGAPGSFAEISQDFTVPGSSVVIEFKWKLGTSEPINLATNTLLGKDDFLRIGLVGPPHDVSISDLLADPAVSFTMGTGAFTLETTGFMDRQEVFSGVAPGPATLSFRISDKEMAPPAAITGVFLDAVVVSLDPPLLEVTDGARYLSTQPGPLFAFANETRTFDSLLLACCAKDGQPSTVSLSGPLMRAQKSHLTVPYFLVGIYPGATLASSSTEPLVLLEGGNHSLGSAVGIFDIEGRTTAVDPASGLALGTDRSLEVGGELFRGDRGTSVTTNQFLKVDRVLLEATAPLLNLIAGSSMKSATDLVELAHEAHVTANLPSDSLIKLNASTLTINRGGLINVAGGSVLSVTGNLVSLTNNSTLNILRGSLVNVSGGSVFTLRGGSLGVFGSGSNALNITNTAPLCSGCSLTTSIRNLGGYPVLLKNGATASNVTAAAGFTPFVGLSESNTVKVSGASGAVLEVNGPASKVRLDP